MTKNNIATTIGTTTIMRRKVVSVSLPPNNKIKIDNNHIDHDCCTAAAAAGSTNTTFSASSSSSSSPQNANHHHHHHRTRWYHHYTRYEGKAWWRNNVTTKTKMTTNVLLLILLCVLALLLSVNCYLRLHSDSNSDISASISSTSAATATAPTTGVIVGTTQQRLKGGSSSSSSSSKPITNGNDDEINDNDNEIITAATDADAGLLNNVTDAIDFIQKHIPIPVPKRSKPLLVIHTGPHKTGTSFLQSLFGESQISKILKQDNFLYGGTCIMKHTKHPDISPCILHQVDAFFMKNPDKHENENVTPTIPSLSADSYPKPQLRILQPNLKLFLNKMQNTGMNGLLVFEEAALAIDELIPILEYYKYDFDIQGIGMHRRLYETIPSAYAEFCKHLKDDPCPILVPPSLEDFLFFNKQEYKHNIEEEYDRLNQYTPNKKYKKITTPDHCLNWIESWWDDIYEGGIHRAVRYLNKMSYNSTNTVIMLDYHANHGILNELFCSYNRKTENSGGDNNNNNNFHLLAETPNLCMAAKTNYGFEIWTANNDTIALHDKSSAANTKLSIDHLQILQKARHYNIITPKEFDYLWIEIDQRTGMEYIYHTELLIEKISMLFQKNELYSNNNPSQQKKIVPKKCISTSKLSKFYNFSWEVEKSIFPMRTEDDHKIGFQKQIDQGAFCFLDVDMILRDPDWISALSNLFIIPPPTESPDITMSNKIADNSIL